MSQEILQGVLGRLADLASQFPDFRFVEFSGPASADDRVIRCALQLFTHDADWQFCRSSAESVFCLCGLEVADAIAALRLVADDLTLAARFMQEDSAAGVDDVEPMAPFPVIRGDDAPFIVAEAWVAMVGDYPQKLRDTFAEMGINLGVEPVPGSPCIYQGPLRLVEGAVLEFPGDVLCRAVRSAPGWAALEHAIDKEQLQVRYSLSPLFILMGSIFENHVELTQLAADAELRHAKREAAATAEAKSSPDSPSVAVGVQRCWHEAHQSFQRAVVAPAAPPPGPLKGVWKWLKEHDPDPEYDLPAFGTWAKYLREYNRVINGRTNEPRGARSGRSISGADEI